MRKIIASVTVLVMVLCCVSTTAFAYSITEETDTGEVGVTSELAYELESSYCINIPEYIDISVGDYIFTADYLNINSNEQVEVRMLDGVGAGGCVILRNELGDELECYVLYNNDELPGGREVGVFTDSLFSDGAMQFRVDTTNGMHYTGKYTSTVTFLVVVDSRDTYG